MTITRRTRMYDIIERYGPIADALEARGIRCRAPRWLREIVQPVASRLMTVERAARVNGVPLETLLRALEDVVKERTAAASVDVSPEAGPRGFARGEPGRA